MSANQNNREPEKARHNARRYSSVASQRRGRSLGACPPARDSELRAEASEADYRPALGANEASRRPSSTCGVLVAVQMYRYRGYAVTPCPNLRPCPLHTRPA